MISVNGTDTFRLRFRGYSLVPGKDVGIQQSESKMSVTAIDEADLTNPETRGVMLASVIQGADREIHLKSLSICGGVETTDA